jgi:hypothetical protein
MDGFIRSHERMLFLGGVLVTSNRALKLWMVNVVSFFLLVLLSVTGLMNWLVLPKGYEARKGFALTARHFLVDVHEWAGLAFMVIIGIHIVLHWSYIRHNLGK